MQVYKITHIMSFDSHFVVYRASVSITCFLFSYTESEYIKKRRKKSICVYVCMYDAWLNAAAMEVSNCHTWRMINDPN